MEGVIIIFVPTLTWLSTSILPPCSSIIFFVMDNPSPVPSDRVEKKGLNILGRFSLGIPMPVSAKIIWTS
jgi:hypothetical protein